MIVLKDSRSPQSELLREYEGAEIKAIHDLDIDLKYIKARMFGIESESIDLIGKKVFVRHYAGDAWMYKRYVKDNGGELVVPNYDLANHWFRDIPSAIQKKYFKRKLGWMDMTEYGYLDELSEHRHLMNDMRKLYDTHARREDGRLFLKADVKQCLVAGLYTYDEAMDKICYWIALSCHNRLRVLVWSEVMDIQQDSYTVNHKKEYRCLIVDNKVSTISMYTEKRDRHFYVKAKAFANEFAAMAATRGFLPHSYCLDVAKISYGEFAVVELNDIAAMGYYADHDIHKFYQDILASCS